MLQIDSAPARRIRSRSLDDHNEGAPLFPEVVDFMRDAGFALYDFGGSYRRETDHALFQIDVVFAKKDSPLRASKKFWLNEP